VNGALRPGRDLQVASACERARALENLCACWCAWGEAAWTPRSWRGICGDGFPR